MPHTFFFGSNPTFEAGGEIKFLLCFTQIYLKVLRVWQLR